MFGGKVGWGELVVVLLIVLVIFGASRLPEIGSAIGKAIKGFKKAVQSEPDSEKEKQDKNNSSGLAT